jgi:LacI family transcriptional regulator
MSKRPTINDIARLAAVSKKTVSRVINNSPFVRAETRARVNAIIAESGFVPDPQARGLAFRRSYLMALVYERGADIAHVQQQILDKLAGTGFELLVRSCDLKDAQTLADIRAFIERRNPAGVILDGTSARDRGVVALLDEIGCRHATADGVSALLEPQAPVRSLKNAMTRRSA